jgi:hypothetical protein
LRAKSFSFGTNHSLLLSIEKLWDYLLEIEDIDVILRALNINFKWVSFFHTWDTLKVFDMFCSLYFIPLIFCFVSVIHNLDTMDLFNVVNNKLTKCSLLYTFICLLFHNSIPLLIGICFWDILLNLIIEMIFLLRVTHFLEFSFCSAEDEYFLKITLNRKGAKFLSRCLYLLFPAQQFAVVLQYIRNLLLLASFPKTEEVVFVLLLNMKKWYWQRKKIAP